MSGTETISDGLAALAAAHGVATRYADWSGRTVEVAPEAVVDALASLDVDAGTPSAVDLALVEVQDAPWRQLLPPVVVVRGSAGHVEVHLDEGAAVSLVIAFEDGSSGAPLPPGVVTGTRDGRQRLRVGLLDLPPGWHRLQATTGAETAEAVLLVAPVSLPPVVGRRWGWMVQLYALRSENSWGIGDYADLKTLLEHTAASGGRALLLNPVHAETPVLPITASPYSPSSRLFRSVLPLAVTQIAATEDVRAAVAALRPDSPPDRIDRDAVWSAKLAALELLWPEHRTDPVPDRPGAGDFALFCALAEQHGTPWQLWPEPLRRPDGPGVPAARALHADRIAFWRWVQALVEQQLADAAAAAPEVLVLHDLAVGVDGGGADAWLLQDALALGASVGAPPDSVNQKGQDWGLPPWRPDRLRELAYAPFRDLVRACLRSAGGLRIDHVMGLFRLWWVPAGASAADGTFVSYDADALLAVLVLEAGRAGAVVVGEDLGTVADTVRATLSRAGVLGSAVAWFEQDHTGAFLEPGRWRADALGSVSTHDLPTMAGWLAEEHVRVRAELGQLGHPLETEQQRVRTERAALLAMLERTGLLARYDGDVLLALHAVLVASPSVLVLGALGDAVGDLRQPNLPGTTTEYPNWQLPVADPTGRPLGLEQVLAHPGVHRLTRLLDDGIGQSDTVERNASPPDLPNPPELSKE